MDTIYVIGPKPLFDQLYSDFLNETGHYYEVGFKNWGAIRHSLDGKLTLLEETPDKFLLEHLNRADVGIFRSDMDGSAAQKCRLHLDFRKENWQQELE